MKNRSKTVKKGVVGKSNVKGGNGKGSGGTWKGDYKRIKTPIDRFYDESGGSFSDSDSLSSGSLSESDNPYAPESESVHESYTSMCSGDVSHCYNSDEEVKKAKRKAKARKRKIDPQMYVLCGVILNPNNGNKVKGDKGKGVERV